MEIKTKHLMIILLIFLSGCSSAWKEVSKTTEQYEVIESFANLNRYIYITIRNTSTNEIYTDIDVGFESNCFNWRLLQGRKFYFEKIVEKHEMNNKERVAFRNVNKIC